MNPCEFLRILTNQCEFLQIFTNPCKSRKISYGLRSKIILKHTCISFLFKVKDGLNAIPTTNKEKADCQKILSPQELHQVIIGPPLVDFSKVCLRSTSRRDISIVNNLDTYIHVVVQVCIIRFLRIQLPHLQMFSFTFAVA